MYSPTLEDVPTTLLRGWTYPPVELGFYGAAVIEPTRTVTAGGMTFTPSAAYTEGTQEIKIDWTVYSDGKWITSYYDHAKSIDDAFHSGIMTSAQPATVLTPTFSSLDFFSPAPEMLSLLSRYWTVNQYASPISAGLDGPGTAFPLSSCAGFGGRTAGGEPTGEALENHWAFFRLRF